MGIGEGGFRGGEGTRIRDWRHSRKRDDDDLLVLELGGGVVLDGNTALAELAGLLGGRDPCFEYQLASSPETGV